MKKKWLNLIENDIKLTGVSEDDMRDQIEQKLKSKVVDLK